ncbi:fumarylacetoacetase [Ponticoccus sp. SC2-23]|uniref:fumarylacetoacetase n=1 Tax=Alexandriicola marinus TaxID=2081710 RepID=UPI000FD7F5F2|nr:fumarylacetoacetase [Alexandriicola marinus]MBM1220431.1 fumarylacetoacetase [Ponticoccus sp. SC6-9]MBM1225117.1 fumarylacetoacetase [Ponticoccus sp. SC6-15]MBM1228631.1 fumarylacetoacetase [Ponticoccus sp. SC6-38]MBM1233732.1 fumarylacetoacetase [Ponticoccus sp. SC6-45]MBM1239132.1 fumarylacetoacetase [Ponticoccus sp. SC6-49]MBM1242914.1 fumarylacetoacetase [Ponticoccus sp. SC2-64]MBM1247256.1 fumarylacetoacetase [Ponticoccus sp. SC6-42]MBM1252085.1 fumarylacetoacetase [Ponticoccus sp. 
MPLHRSWVESANAPDSPFPLNNLPYGVFDDGYGARCCVAIGDFVLDLGSAAGRSMFPDAGFNKDALNDFMNAGPGIWRRTRNALTGLLAEGSQATATLADMLIPRDRVRMRMPFRVAEYTDFYAGRNHAFNVGTMFRGPENALPPNWLSIPIGYNGRASSVVVSGTAVTRPWGQLKGPDDDLPRFAPSARFDLELEMGAIVGQPSHGMISVAQADEMIFGYVLLNDWSARDIQAWEYQPLGPFQAKATATTISPWVVPRAALEPFRTSTPARERPLLPYLQEPGPMLYNIDLEVGLAPKGKAETVISRTNMNQLYYSSAQQLAHHATSGCPMRVGDLLGTGTISGEAKDARGSLLELSWGGKEPLTLDTGETRTFLEDGDTLTLRGMARGDGYTIGFGDCAGTVRPAVELPDWARE